METNIDVQQSLEEKAAAYHATLDQLSDQIDDFAGDADRTAAVTLLRKKVGQLRIHIRLLRRSRSDALSDLEAGIDISIGEIKRSVIALRKH